MFSSCQKKVIKNNFNIDFELVLLFCKKQLQHKKRIAHISKKPLKLLFYKRNEFHNLLIDVEMKIIRKLIYHKLLKMFT